MSKFIYHIHYRPGFKIGKPDSLSRRLGEEQSEIDAHVFNEVQLLGLDNDNVGNEEDSEDMKLEGIAMYACEKKNRLWVVPQEHKLEVLRQNHDSQVAGHEGRHQTLELVSWNFIQNKQSEDVARYVAECVNC